MNTSLCSIFPSHSFPPIAKEAIEEISCAMQCPSPLAGGIVLAAMSLATQDLATVRRPGGLLTLCSLFVLTIGDSGIRKTSTEKLIFAPFHKFQSAQDTEFDEKQTSFLSTRRIFLVRQKALQKRLSKAIAKGESCDCIERELFSHALTEPKMPRRDKLIYNDTTPAALLYGLHANSSSAGIVDDEAGRIVEGPLAKDLGLITKAWDGADLHVERRTSESFVVRRPRLMISWLLQNRVFSKYLERKGDDARGIGFFARCLISCPTPLNGSRFITGESTPLEKLPRFTDRITELLERRRSLSNQGDSIDEVELHFSPEAQSEWVGVFNEIERQINPGGVFCESQDYASKVAENIARVAGVFHSFAGHEGTSISLDTLRSATSLVLWYAHEFVRLFSPPDPLHETIQDAYELEAWLAKLYRSRRWTEIERNFVLQRGPNKLRSRDRFRWAMDCLQANGRVFQYQIGKKWRVRLNMNFFDPTGQGI